MSDNYQTFEDSDEEPDDLTINFKPSFVLLALDTHPSMFQVKENDDGTKTHCFKDVLEVCYEIVDSLVLASSGRNSYKQFGIVLVDEDEKATFVEVGNNVLETVKFLKQKASMSNEELQAAYERKGDINLASFFLLCKKKFKEINSAYYKRTLILITKDDNPLQGNSQKNFVTLNEVKTFEPSDINFELVPVNVDFDFSNFYTELFHVYGRPLNAADIYSTKESILKKLSGAIVIRYTKIRYNFYPFKDDYGRFLKVMKMNFIRPAKLMSTHRASLDNKVLVKIKESASLSAASYAITSDVGEEFAFSLQDKVDLQKDSLPMGLHLQYVSDRQTDVGVVLGKLSVLVVDPKEELNYFDQFWQYCINNNKVLICLKKFKQLCDKRYVELIPKFANNQKVFILKDMPYQKEYPFFQKAQKVPNVVKTEISTEQKKVIENFLELISSDYNPMMFSNLSYCKKKEYLKAKLLDTAEKDVEDPTGESFELQMDDQIKDVVRDMERVFGIGQLPQGQKRKAASKASTKTKKRN